MPDVTPTIWMDLTTSLRSRGAPNNGTLRVERSLARELRLLLGDHLRFCRYDPLRRRFEAADTAAALDGAPQEPKGRGPGASNERSDSIGKRVERAVRLTVRRWAREFYHAIGGADASAHFAEAKPGDTLLLAGETWSARFDFDVIARLRTECGLTIAAVCQDVIPVTHPQFFETGSFVDQYRRYVQFLAREADLVIAISQATARGLEQAAAQFGGMRGSIAVIELGSDAAKSATPSPPRIAPPLEPGRFVISVSTIQSRKNFDLLYRLWKRFAREGRKDVPRLVIVGRRGFGSEKLLADISGDATARDALSILDGATDAELAWLYENCAYTLYPSFVEGWGLPISESLARGKLCLASDTSSLPEAGAGLARHFGPNDDQAWYEAIVELAEKPQILADAEARIRANYRQRSWGEAAADLAARLR